MTELTDLNDTDALNTAVTGQSTEGNTANMGGMDNLFQATLGMLSRFRNSNIFRLRDNTDKTKLLAFDLSGLLSGTTTFALPTVAGTLGTVPRGHIFGLTLSNNATDATNDIDIAVGEAASSDTAPSLMVLASALTKRLDAAWAVGTGNGGRFYSAVAIGWAYVYLIKRPDTGVVDVGFSDNQTDPTGGANYPAAYTLYRRVGAVAWNGSTIIGFVHDGDDFWYKVAQPDISTAVLGTTPTNYPVTVPPIAGVKAYLQGQASNASGWVIGLYATGLGAPTVFQRGPAGVAVGFGQFAMRVNSSTHVTAVSSASNTTFALFTVGYVDTRGRV